MERLVWPMETRPMKESCNTCTSWLCTPQEGWTPAEDHIAPWVTLRPRFQTWRTAKHRKQRWAVTAQVWDVNSTRVWQRHIKLIRNTHLQKSNSIKSQPKVNITHTWLMMCSMNFSLTSWYAHKSRLPQFPQRLPHRQDVLLYSRLNCHQASPKQLN